MGTKNRCSTDHLEVQRIFNIVPRDIFFGTKVGLSVVEDLCVPKRWDTKNRCSTDHLEMIRTPENVFLK
jgi:hypothetical protein